MTTMLNNEIKHIAIIGTGKMGTSLFEYLLDKDLELTWLTRSNDRIEELTKKTEKRLKHFLKFGLKSKEEFTRLLKKIEISTNYELLSKADLVIETVCEDIDIKKSVLAKAFKYIPEHAGVSTNSSSIMPGELLGNNVDIYRLFGLHFFFPVVLTMVVEFITHTHFNNAMRGRINQFLERIDLTVIPQDGNNAFLINMLTMPIAGEAFILANKVGFKVANELTSSEIFPMGLFYLFDQVGIDIILESNKRYYNRDLLKNKDSYIQLLHFMKLMADAGRKGDEDFTKFLSGTLEYPHDLPLWKQQDNYSLKLTNKESNNIRKRLLLLLIDTCFYAVEHNLIESEKLEYAWKNIMGAAKGPFQMASEIGYENLKEGLTSYYSKTGLNYYRF